MLLSSVSTTFLAGSGLLLAAYLWLTRELRPAARRRRPLFEGGPGTEIPDEGTALAEIARASTRAPLWEGDPDEQIRRLKRIAGERGEDAVPLLAARLGDPVPEIAAAAAECLAGIGGAAALSALLSADGKAAAIQDRRPGRLPVAEAPAGDYDLERLDAAPGAPPPSATDSNRAAGRSQGPARGAAAHRLPEPLAKSGYRALHRYTPHDPETLTEAELVRVLTAMAGSAEERPALRYYALRSLDAFRATGIGESLVDLLSDPLPLVRYAAAESLATHGDGDSVPWLVGALSDPEPNVRASAAHSLAVLGGDRAIRPLLDLRDDPDPTVRYAVRRALEEIGRRKKMGNLLGGVEAG